MNLTNNPTKNFKYLNNLIQNNTKIILTSDIILDDDEEEVYKFGIEINKDDVIIEGNGHIIDAKNKTRIFEVKCKNITIKNLIFKNGFNIIAGSILNSHNSCLNLVDCEFTDNSTNRSGGSILNNGYINIKNTNFLNNDSTDGGCINNQKSGVLDIINCIFKNNSLKSGGGVIINWGDVCINDSKFENNFSKGRNGGCITNQITGIIDLNNCEFKKNLATEDGGTIFNLGCLSICESKFFNNQTKTNGGCINNLSEGKIEVSSSVFEFNYAIMSGGVIINWGNISLNDTKFQKNTSKENDGGCINNQSEGKLDITKCEFIENTSKFGGGAIINWGKVSLKKSKFYSNVTKEVSGAAICNMLGSVLTCYDGEFVDNKCQKVGACIFNESEDSKVIKSVFKNHENVKNLVYNKNKLSLIDCVFKDNMGIGYHIYNGLKSSLDILGGKIIDNTSKKTTIHNFGGYLTINKTLFKNNVSLKKNCGDILNQSHLMLSRVKFKTNVCTVLNCGQINAEKLSDDKIIKNIKKGFVEIEDIYSENKANFINLNKIINKKNKIALKRDYKLENYESKFFECGIELHQDNLVIDGKGKTINGNNKSRIFLITGKNITLKNIIFKNGHSANDFDEHINGGGALKITKNASLNLEDCTFLNNSSADDGGAILNNGNVTSKNSKFVDNHAKYNGGAIINKNLMYMDNNIFNNNKSRIAGAIYNSSQLIIKNNINLCENTSELKNPIYNADSIKLENFQINCDEIIYNTGKINKKGNEFERLDDFKNKLNQSNNIFLKKDIRSENSNIININEDLIINGNNHIIDMNNHNINFKVNSAHIVIKNIIFKNVHLTIDFLFEINGTAIFENVRFLNNHLSKNQGLIKNNNILIIKNSVFANNISKNESLINNESSLEISNSNFINNYTQSQACIIRNNNKSNIKESCFICNFSKKESGNIYNDVHSILNIINTRFISNVSHTDGGSIINKGDLNLSNCDFIKNKAEGSAGAIANMKNSNLKLDNCVLKDNISNKAGGAIINFGNLSLNDCELSNNETKRNGGAINNQNGAFVNLKNTLFKKNSAGENGGAIWIHSPDENNFKLINCILTNNNPNNIY